jgi:predicted nucleic acid-binding protein
VYKIIFREYGKEAATEILLIMGRGCVIELDSSIAITSADISMQYKLAIADSIIYASAVVNNAALWTADEHFAGLPGVCYYEKS